MRWILFYRAWMTVGLLGCSVNALAQVGPRVWVLPEVSSFTWTKETNTDGTQPATVLVGTSPLLDPGVKWREVVLSWNVRAPIPDSIRFQILPEVCGGNPVYEMGTWSRELDFRKSRNNQEDQWGEVKTDVLRLKNQGQRFRVRLLVSDKGEWNGEGVRFLGVTFWDDKGRLEGGGETGNGRVLEVPTISQMDYEDGGAWCSPTCVTMILNYWAERLGRTEMAVSVPWTASQVHDSEWPGTGNWPFNVAFGGEFEGMRGVVARLGGLGEVEQWIEAGVPVALSVSYNRLKGKPQGGSGHLVVCVGFTPEGEVVINDPGTRYEKRKVISREVMETAWEESNRTVYLIYPESYAAPEGFFQEFTPLDAQ